MEQRNGVSSPSTWHPRLLLRPQTNLCAGRRPPAAALRARRAAGSRRAPAAKGIQRTAAMSAYKAPNSRLLEDRDGREGRAESSGGDVVYVSPYRAYDEEEQRSSSPSRRRQRLAIGGQRGGSKGRRSSGNGWGGANRGLSPGALSGLQWQVGEAVDCVVVAVRKHGVLMRFEVEAGGASFPPPATPAAILAADDACTIGWDDKEEREGGWPGMWREVGDATPDKKSTNSNSTVERAIGMVPTEELSWIRTRAKQTKDLVSVGQHLQAVVTGVDLTRRHVQLSVRQAARSPLGNRAGAAAEEGARREGAARRAQQWSSDRELIEGAIKLRVALLEHAAKDDETAEELWWLDECRPVLRHLLRRAVSSPGGPELGQGLALLEAAGEAASFETAAEVCMGGLEAGSKRLARAVAANWEPTLVARMLAALPASLEPFHQLLREFKISRNEAALQLVLSELDRRYATLAPTSLTYRHIIAAYGEMGRLEEARRTFKAMRAAGIDQDVGACNALLAAVGQECRAQAMRSRRQGREAEAAGAALKVFVRFRQLQDEGLLQQPDIVTYNILLRACSTSGDLKRAERVLAWIHQDGLAFTAHTFTSLINLYEAAGVADRLLQVVDEMEASGFHPSRKTWSSLVLACGRLGQLELAFSIWQRQIRMGPLPTVTEYDALVQACESCRQGFKALEVLKAMKMAGHRPNLKTYALVLAALQSQASLLPTRSKGLKEEVVSAIVWVKEDMAASGLRGTGEIYSRLVSMCTDLGDYDTARLMAEEMKQLGLRLDSICCTALIKGYGAAGWVDEAHNLYQRMREGPLYMRPSRVTHLVLADVCQQQGRLDLALQVYNDMRSAGFEPCDSLFRTLTEDIANKVVEGAAEGGGSGSRAPVIPMTLPNAAMAEVENLSAGDAHLDLTNLSSAEARAAVLGMLNAIQLRYRDTSEIRGDLVMNTGMDCSEASSQLQSTIQQLFQDINVGSSATVQPSPGQGIPGPSSCVVKVSCESLRAWQRRKA